MKRTLRLSAIMFLLALVSMSCEKDNTESIIGNWKCVNHTWKAYEEGVLQSESSEPCEEVRHWEFLDGGILHSYFSETDYDLMYWEKNGDILVLTDEGSGETNNYTISSLKDEELILFASSEYDSYTYEDVVTFKRVD